MYARQGGPIRIVADCGRTRCANTDGASSRYKHDGETKITEVITNGDVSGRGVHNRYLVVVIVVRIGVEPDGLCLAAVTVTVAMMVIMVIMSMVIIVVAVSVIIVVIHGGGAQRLHETITQGTIGAVEKTWLQVLLGMGSRGFSVMMRRVPG